MFEDLKNIIQRFRDKDSTPSSNSSFLEFSTNSPKKDRYVLIVCNQKGGCAKTTTVINLSAYWAHRRKKVLIIDLDTQAHASLGLGVDVDHLPWTIYDVLIHNVDLERVIVPTTIPNLSIAPANHLLSGAQLELANMVARENILRIHLNKLFLHHHYDYVVIDTSPTLNLITLNGLAAATHVLIPLQTHYFALEGMKELLFTIDVVRQRLNSELKVAGILPTMFDARLKVNKEILQDLSDFFKELLLKTTIHYNNKLLEAPRYRQPISVFAPDSRGARDYQSLTDELEQLLKGSHNAAQLK